MRKYRFYSEQELFEGAELQLPEFEARHLRNSLRLNKGDEIIVFDGKKEFSAKLTLVSNKAATANVESLIREISERKTKLSLAISLIKPAQFELAIEKVTELGAVEILPLQSKYSIIKAEIAQKKLERWRKILTSAAKQSERIDIPVLHSPVSFEEFVNESSKDFDLKIILHTPKNRDEMNTLIPLKDVVIAESSSVLVAIGPEGGFTEDEVTSAKEAGFKVATLGENILRAETAAIVATAILQG